MILIIIVLTIFILGFLINTIVNKLIASQPSGEGDDLQFRDIYPNETTESTVDEEERFEKCFSIDPLPYADAI